MKPKIDLLLQGIIDDPTQDEIAFVPTVTPTISDADCLPADPGLDPFQKILDEAGLAKYTQNLEVTVDPEWLSPIGVTPEDHEREQERDLSKRASSSGRIRFHEYVENGERFAGGYDHEGYRIATKYLGPLPGDQILQKV